jgi:hypothetical protein
MYSPGNLLIWLCLIFLHLFYRCFIAGPRFGMKSKILQFLLGSFLGLSLMGIVAAGGLFLVVQQLTARPPRPSFDNDNPNFNATPSPRNSPNSTAPPVAPSAVESPPGSYRARVAFPDGLSVRDAPDGARVGGLDFKEEVLVLEESEDKLWIKIRSVASSLEGWIKAGNVDKVE